MKENQLYILWTNDNLITAEMMVFMYGINSKRKKWWNEVTVIIWGATAKLVAENIKIQELIEEAKLEGVHISACKSCAEHLGLLEKLELLNIEIKYWGEPLTQLLRNNAHILTI